MAKRQLVKPCMKTRDLCRLVEFLSPQTVKPNPKAPLGRHPLLLLLAQCYTPRPFSPLSQFPFFVSYLTNSKHDQLWN